MNTVGWRSPLGGPRSDEAPDVDDEAGRLEGIEIERREIERARATCVPDDVREQEQDREVRADGGHERRCPECGEPVAVTAAHGPDRAILEPCGHTLPLTFVPDLQSAE